MKKVAVLIDGGFLRELAKQAKVKYDPDFIERFAHACREKDEELFRVLYYDCAPYSGTAKLPISGAEKVFHSNDEWLHRLARKDLFAVRWGVLKFRGYVRRTPRTQHGQAPAEGRPLTDADFKPLFEQKGVDMRIGLDVAAYSANRAVDRIVLVTGDTDCIPTLKYARRAGLQTVLVQPGTRSLVRDLLAHCDYKRVVPLAEGATVACGVLPYTSL